MPSSPAHNARQAAVSGWQTCLSLPFKWCIVVDIVGLVFLVAGLTLISLGFSPSQTKPGRLGEVPIDSGDKGMQIAGLVILPIGVLAFFTGLALTVKSVRYTASKERNRIVSPVAVTIRPTAPTGNANRPRSTTGQTGQVGQAPQHRAPNNNAPEAPSRYATVSVTEVYSHLPTKVSSAPRLSTATTTSSDVFYIEQYDVTPRRNVPQGFTANTPGIYNPYYASNRGRSYAPQDEYEEPPPPFNPNYATRPRY